MFNNTEGTHLRKYLATLGVSVSIGALGAGGFLLRSPGDLLIKQDDLRRLTPIARDAIEHRQGISYAIAFYGPYVLAAVALVGIGLATFGLLGWARRQQVTDKIEDLEHEKIQAEIQQISREDKIAQADREAVEDQQGTGVNGLPPEGAEITRSRDTLRDRILLVSSLLGDKLSGGFRDRQVRTDVTLEMDSNTKFQLDALVLGQGASSGYIIELKYTSNSAQADRRVREARQQALLAADVLNKENFGSNFQPVAVVIFPENSEWPEKINRRYSQLESSAVAKVKILAFDFASFLALPGEQLRNLIEDRATRD